MHLTRLSRIETVPSIDQSIRPRPRMGPMGKIICRVASTTILLAATILVLVSLILPNQSTFLSAMTIRPVGKQFVPATMVHGASTAHPSPMPTGLWGMSETDANEPNKVRKSEQKIKTPMGTVTWFGITGPQIWVGTMQICSRSDRDAEVVCTASSKPTYHARVLPLNLGDAMEALPERPIAPVLLIVTCVCIILAILVQVLSFVRCTRPPIWRRRKTSQSSSGSDDILEQKPPRPTPHPAFLFLTIVAFILSVAAAALERQAVNAALGAWDKAAAAEIGMTAEMGPIAHLMPCIPVLLAITLFIAYIPYLLDRHPCRSPTPVQGAEIIGRAEISGLFANVEDSGKKLEDGRPVFAEISPGTPRSFTSKKQGLPDIVITADRSDSGSIKKEALPKSAESWRTFGVGEAV